MSLKCQIKLKQDGKIRTDIKINAWWEEKRSNAATEDVKNKIEEFYAKPGNSTTLPKAKRVKQEKGKKSPG